MLDGGKKIDAVFKDGLSNHEVTPDTYVWESIEKSMQKQRRQAAAIIMWRNVAAACVIALIAVSAILLNSVSEPLINQSVEVTSAINQKATATNSNFEQEAASEIDNNPSEVLVPEDNMKIVSEEYDNSTDASSITSYRSVEKENVEKEVTIGMEFLAAISSIDVGVDNEVNTDLHLKKEKVYYSIFNPLNVSSSVNSKKKTSISIGGILSPSYNSKVASGGNESVMAASGVDVNENGINSLGGGLQVRVNTGSRWSFETGVLYAQVGQEVSNDYSSQSYKQAFLSREVSNSSGLANSMGSIKVSKTAYHAVADPLIDNMVEASFGPVSNVNSIKQTLDYIEIPMMARYSLLKNFPYLSVAGGFSSNFLVDNAAYALDGGSEKKIGETNDIKSFVLSSSVGLGIDVPIYKSIHLNVEPRLKYFLNSVSSNNDYNFQPYSFGVYGGLTFVIK